MPTQPCLAINAQLSSIVTPKVASVVRVTRFVAFGRLLHRPRRQRQALAYVHFEDEPGWRAAAHLLTRDEAADRGEYREVAGLAAMKIPRLP